jgi:hypothetical protein
VRSVVATGCEITVSIFFPEEAANSQVHLPYAFICITSAEVHDGHSLA